MRVASLALLCAACATSRGGEISAQDRQFHQDALVVDAHCDIAEAILLEGYDLLSRHDDHHVDLPRLQEGGIDAEIFSIFVHPESVDLTQFFPTALREIELLQKAARASGGALQVARNADEVRDNADKGVTSMLLSLEGGHLLLPGTEEEQLAHLKAFADRGVRSLALSWSASSPLGGSTADDQGRGLTPLGRRVLAQMERLGIVADLSHGSDALFWDVMKAAGKPILLTHSASRALSNHPRNASDEMLQALARNGGAACVDFSPTFLDDRFRRATQELLKTTKGLRNAEKTALYRKEKLPEVPLSRLVEHIEHMRQVAGIDHVCLGSDFDGAPLMPAGLEDASRLPALTAALRARGWTAEDLKKLLGENLLRVLAASEGR
ncbi:MAG TPA: membrane dipeptidase [Myxococcales bacterium]|nr:membrane dipeptidase [Myxococcales bacterium]